MTDRLYSIALVATRNCQNLQVFGDVGGFVLKHARNGRLKIRGDDCQKAMIDCTIGTQPFIPAVYGVNAPL